MKCLRLAAGTFSWLTISVTEISSMSSISDGNRSISPMDSMAPSHKSRWAKQRAKIKAGKTAEKREEQTLHLPQHYLITLLLGVKKILNPSSVTWLF